MRLIFRMKCAFWLWVLSGLGVCGSWSYARGMVRDFFDEWEDGTVREAVEEEMSYWEDPE